jgi:hypothetical protein
VAKSRITLIGGPGDGLEVEWDRGDDLQWKPATDQDFITLRMHHRVPSEHDPVRYRRSLRSRDLFVYQP